MSSHEQAVADNPSNIQVHLALGSHATEAEKELAREVGNVMVRYLMSIGYGNISPPQVTLNIFLQTCDLGSSWGRICCAELGVGWVVLACQCSLDEQVGPESVMMYRSPTRKLQDSGAIGCADLCDSNYGETTLKRTLATKMANHIWATIQNPLTGIKKKEREKESVKPCTMTNSRCMACGLNLKREASAINLRVASWFIHNQNLFRAQPVFTSVLTVKKM